MVVVGADPTHPLAEILQAFKLPRGHNDELPRALATSPEVRTLDQPGVWPRVPTKWRQSPGVKPEPSQQDRLRISESRRLLTARPEAGLPDIFAVPTAMGRVALIVPDIGSGVLASLEEGITLSVHRTETGGPLYVYGLVEDGMSKVQVQIADDWYDAVLGQNVFFVAITEPVTATSIAAIELRNAAGESRRVELRQSR
jgi:hypothetical protein